MFNIQPGQGLGFSASKEIAYGLGTPFAVVVIIIVDEVKHEGGMIGAIPGRFITPAQKLELRKQIIREDEEMVVVLIRAVVHEVV
ncbi:MAG: hypothetical protein GWN00_19510 [Aliifodinibius sp.]|nr:hypothetical protein [Fodinibius sp.]NIY26912.1 hypothetical protein [Fodinibius sp.]